MRPFLKFLIASVAFVTALHAAAVELRVATFNVDATPPVGSPLGGGSVPPMEGVSDPLSARGVVLLPEGQAPVVLCAVDWIGIGNGGHAEWREALAEAVNTPVERVAVQTLHQHDAPFCDFTTEALMAEQNLAGKLFDVEFARETIERTANAAKAALNDSIKVSHVGMGKAKVEKVASNRRILGPDGKVKQMRWTACADPKLRAEPEGVIDPWLRSVSFWNGDEPIAILTYYATHPQSYYRTGMVSADFPGLARAQREEELPETAHIHFDGAGGNIGAGKYNDGSHENRAILAGRMRDGMKAAFEATERAAVEELEFDWSAETITLPIREEISVEEERSLLKSDSTELDRRVRAARELAWIERATSGKPITIGRLRLGSIQIIHLPGELFVEYQLAAQKMAPDDFVCMAAYGDYGPGYIGTEEAYPQGGYETSLHTSRTAPEVEGVLMGTMKKLLER